MRINNKQFQALTALLAAALLLNGCIGLAESQEAPPENPGDSPSTLAISTTSLPAGQVQTSYQANLAAEGGKTPYAWRVKSGQLPQGVALNALSGALSGMPTKSGKFTVAFEVADADARTAEKTLSVDVAAAPLAISTVTLPSGQVQSAYSAQVNATGGSTPHSWSVSTGSLPPGLTLAASTGTISGTPTAHGSYAFTIRVQDAGSPQQVASQPLTISVFPAQLSVTTTSLPGGAVSTAYQGSLAATGGVPPYGWAVVQGALPPGLSLNASTGIISGTPSQAGSFNFTVYVSDAAQASATRALSITIATGVAPIAISTASLPNAQVQAAYSASLAAAGGTPPYTWSISSGALPAGLSLNGTTGVISGTPTGATTATFTVRVRDSGSPQQTTTKQFSITVNPAALAISTSSLAAGQVGVSYAASVAATGGTTPYSWSISQGSLPAGLSLNSSSGAISGTPSAAGTSSFTVRVQDSSGAAATRQLSITVNPAALAISTSSLAAGQVGVSYSASVAATGGTTPYSWSISQGSLPAGLSLNSSSGAISGTPSASGTSNFTVRVQDSNGTAATRQLSITVNPAALAISTSSLAAGQVGVSYSASVAATGGTTPYSWSISQGSLPAGLSLNSSSGAISGTPSASGTSNFTVRVQDSNGTAATRQLSITVNPAALAISTSSLAAGQVGVSYSASVAATGGTTPYSWSISQGSLPAGLSLNSSSGAISGTPSAAGTSSFTVRVQDSNGTAATRQLSITVNPAALAISTSSLAAGQVGVSYSASVAATGGTTPYSWSISQGSLPAGLSLNSSSGAISGTPSAAGTSSFTVRVQDSSGAAATRQLSISIAAASSSGPSPGSGDSIIFQDGFESGNLNAWDSQTSRHQVSTEQARSGTRSVRISTSSASSSGNLQKWFMPGYDEVYVKFYLYLGSNFNMPGMHMTALMGNRTDDQWSAHGKAGIRPNGTDFFHSALDLWPELELQFYSYWPGMSCPSSGQCWGNYIEQTAPVVRFQSGQWYEVVHRIKLNTPGQLDGLQELWINGQRKISQTGMRWRDSDILRLNEFDLQFYVGDGVSSTMYAWVDDVTVWRPGTSSSLPPEESPALSVSPTSLSFSFQQGATPACQSVQIQNTGGGTLSWSAQASWNGFSLTPSSGNAPATMQVCIANPLAIDPGVYQDSVTITASGAQGSPRTISISTTVTQPVATLSVYNTSLPDGTVGSAYSAALQAGGGVSPYSWSISQGSLPAGLSLNSSTGAISGTPTAAGTSTFTVRVQDGVGTAATRQLSITVSSAAASLQITTSSLPGGTVGSSYSATLAATGGTTPYSWSISSGSLPAGLSLNSSTGALSGTPSTSGTSSFTARVQDATGTAVTKSLSISISSSSPPAAAICAEDFESRSLSSSGSFQVGCIPGRIDGSGSSVTVTTQNPISGTRSLRFSATTSASRAEIVPGFTSAQLAEGVYFAYSYRADQIGTFGTKTHIVEPRGNWLQIHTDCQNGNCDVTTVEHDNGTAMPETFGTIRAGEVQRWKYYFRYANGVGTIRIWVNGVLRLDRSGSNYGGAVSEARSGHPYLTGYWNSSNRSGTLVFTMDDIVISLTDPDGTSSSFASARESASESVVQDDFESGDWSRWNSSRLMQSAEESAGGRYSARADHSAGSLTRDAAEAYFGDYLNQGLPAEDVQVEFDILLGANVDVQRGQGAACGTALARLLANDDGQSLYGEPFPYAPYLLTLCLDEQLEPRFELLRRTGTTTRQALTQNQSVKRLTPGKWHKLAYRARLNTLGRADGQLELWIDGQLAARYTGVDFRGSFGGKGWNMFQLTGEDSAAPARTWYQYWDNVIVSRMQP